MGIEVNLKKFSNSDPLDFQQLNDIIDAVILIGTKMPTIETPQAPGGNTGGTVQTSITVANSDKVTSAVPITSKADGGTPKVITYKDASGNQIVFSAPPKIVVSARQTSTGKGLAIANLKEVGSATFTVQAGWTAPRTTSGDITIDYIAIGTVNKSSAPASTAGTNGSAGTSGSTTGPTYVAPRGAFIPE
jgi:hypothetical protein